MSANFRARLTLRGTYILPTRAGLLLGFAWLVVVVACLNFGLGVMLLITLLLGGIGLITMVETVRNLAGLTVTVTAPPPVMVGSDASFALRLFAADGRPRERVELWLDGNGRRSRWAWWRHQNLPPRQRIEVSVPAAGADLILPVPTGQRGLQAAGHLQVRSVWPLGLFVAWRTWQTHCAAGVYPVPAVLAPADARTTTPTLSPEVPPALSPRAPATAVAIPPEGDFSGHRRAREQEAHPRIDWRASLRARTLLVADHRSTPPHQNTALTWESEAPAPTEVRLARLTARVLALTSHPLSGNYPCFSLSLPGTQLPAGRGSRHRARALQALAEFPPDANPPDPPPVPAPAAGRPPPARRTKAELPAAEVGYWTACILLASLPLASQLGWSTSLPWALLLVFRLLLLWRRQPAPGGIWLVLLPAAASAWILLTQHTLIGRAPGMALLLVMAGLKLLEVHRSRDLHLLTGLAWFLLLSAHFETQAPWLGGWDLLVALASLYGLIRHYQPALRPQARRGLLWHLTLPALPLALLLFLLLPRPDHAFWGSAAPEGTSGSLSERMSPGSISHLRLSETVVLRVHFAAQWPERSQMYWRGPVLENFDGQTWSTLGFRLLREAPPEHHGQAIDYVLDSDDSDGDWLFGLDTIETSDPDLMVDGTGAAHIRPGRVHGSGWSLRAWPDAHPDAGRSLADLDHDLQVPDGNPRARALAMDWRRLPPLERVAAARQTFLQAHLQYSLDVPAPRADAVDDLLFDTRIGYCEHFASAFAFLLRVAGVPARVVTGYQGGERNPLGDYLIVRQSDAHAWVEAWLEGRGWLRIDPTALTLPARVAEGTQVAVPLPAPAWMPGFLRAGMPLLHRVQLLRDLAAMRWQRDVANLGAREQSDLLAELGLGRLPVLQLFAACAGVVVLGMALPLLNAGLPGRGRRQRALAAAGVSGIGVDLPPTPPWPWHWRAGTRLLALAGCQRAPDEGPLAFVNRVAVEHPQLAVALRAWAEPALRARYAAPPATAASAAGAASLHLVQLTLALLTQRD